MVATRKTEKETFLKETDIGELAKYCQRRNSRRWMV
jgi:hypothetical protein